MEMQNTICGNIKEKQYENYQEMCSLNIISSFETEMIVSCKTNDDANKQCLPCEVQTNVESARGRYEDIVKSREQCGVRG